MPWQVRTNGVVVFVPKYGIEGPVYLTDKAKDASMQVCPASHVKSATKESLVTESSIQHLCDSVQRKARLPGKAWGAM